MLSTLCVLVVLTATPADGLIAAGKVYPGAHVCESEPNAYLMRLAQDHANYMARVQTQGHQGFQGRFDVLAENGYGHAAEICAESWPWETRESYEFLGAGMFKSWKSTADAPGGGHWTTAARKHRFYGAGMALGRNGTWYACILVTD